MKSQKIIFEERSLHDWVGKENSLFSKSLLYTVFQYFRWRSGPATADQSRRRTAPRWYLLLLSFSLSLLRRYFQFLAGPLGSLTPFRLTMLCGRYQMCINPPPPTTHQTTTSSSSYSSPHKHTRQTTAIRCQRRFIHFILSRSFLTAFMCYNTLRFGIFC